ncbi:MAG: zinc ribbon domain-containing protein [Anaerolineales bacterium]|nr:zinc ribbon domain-containing protein [Anaerolineales bacterium]
MPVYIYQCENCGVRFERHQHFSEPALKRCPECYKNTLRKVYTPVGVVYRGSGFYSTDHRATTNVNRSNGNTKPEKEDKSTETKQTVKTAEKSKE